MKPMKTARERVADILGTHLRKFSAKQIEQMTARADAVLASRGYPNAERRVWSWIRAALLAAEGAQQPYVSLPVEQVRWLLDTFGESAN